MAYKTYFAISSARGDFYATEQLIEELEQSFPKSFYVFMGNICTGPNPFKVYRFIKKLIQNKQALLLKGDMEAKYCYDYESGNKDNLSHYFPDKKLSDTEQQLIYELFNICPDYQTYAVDGEKFMLTTAIMPRTNLSSRYVCNDKTGIYANNISMMAYAYIDASLNYLAIETFPYVRAISLDSGWCHSVKRTEYEENTSKSMNIDFDARDIIMNQRYGSIMPPENNVGSRFVNFVDTKNIYGKGEHYIFSPICNNIDALKRIIDDISLQDEDPTYIFMSGLLGYKKSLDTLAFISSLNKYDYIIILGELEQNFIDAYKLDKSKKNLKEFFEEKDDWENIAKYEVIERFPLHGERRYTLYNLRCDIEGLGDDEIVVFYDAEEVLFEDMTRVLNAFLISTLKNVSYQSKFGKEHIVKFKFSSGYIEIREGKRNLRIA